MLAAPDTFDADDLDDLLADDLISDGLLFDALERTGTGRAALLAPSIDAAMDAGHLLANAELYVSPAHWLDYLEDIDLPYPLAVQYVDLAALGVSVEEAVARGGIAATLKYRPPRAMDALNVLEIVGGYYSVSVEDLKGHRRGRTIDFFRHVVGYVLLESGYGPAGVGRMLNGRRHSNVQVAHRRVAEAIAADRAERQAVAEISDALRLAGPPAAADPDVRRARLDKDAQWQRGYRAANADEINRRRREHWAANADEINRRRREHRAANADEINRRRREHRAANADEINRRRREHRAANADEINRRRREHWAANADEINRRLREHRAANADEINRRRREHWAANADEINRRRRQRRADDPELDERNRQSNRKHWAANADEIKSRRRQQYWEKKPKAADSNQLSLF